ncbi:DUF3365 domain-containing protein [Euhalothece natronophila Z-M001]|uniref:DUF3365 domain-containing protein n=1 Tax=Euhalothece natronophila Z-M001 TaxID=522448 RepID=A0A5B8NNJ6_9CHRO|nr:DUF3365 domain-containing protein [Euhalothece natronophila]QDZ40853.1 DUF3365 domain-containing protein [Euhalothece natronophila Z-M001]
MSKFLLKIVFSLLLAFSLLILPINEANAQPQPEQLGEIVQEIESLDAMRSSLAGTLKGTDETPTIETFKQVCKPVGMRAKQLSQENPWDVKQVAEKYRNPDHAPTEKEAMALEKFANNPNLFGFWETADQETYYYRRINVEATCLKCHGLKSERPEFVKQRYPNDKAYDFSVGDLRGMYRVVVPEVKEQIQAALQ